MITKFSQVPVIILLFLSLLSQAQDEPVGKFLKDSLKIGEEVQYSLSVRYPRDMDVLFPDTLFNFSPFEINGKDYFFTRSDGSYSFDSVVYNLSTFEVDSIQYLRLPVFLIRGDDSVAMYPDPDSVILAHVVTQVPDSIAYLENTVYKEVSLDFNYPYLIAGLVLLAVIILLIIIFFGGRIRRSIILYRLNKSHKKFVTQYQEHLDTSNINPEPALYQWKKYMEKLEKFPYTKSTTKEIVVMEGNKEIQKSLRSIDRAIYGKITEQNLKEKFFDLLSFSDKKYQLIVEKIKYGAESPQ